MALGTFIVQSLGIGMAYSIIGVVFFKSLSKFAPVVVCKNDQSYVIAFWPLILLVALIPACGLGVRRAAGHINDRFRGTKKGAQVLRILKGGR